MTDDRLSSGMKATEAVQRAAVWWDKTGRGLVTREFVETKSRRVSKPKPGLPLMVVKDVDVDAFSGILQGKPFAELSPVEQTRVVKAWHHEFIVAPTLAPAPAPATLQ